MARKSVFLPVGRATIAMNAKDLSFTFEGACATFRNTNVRLFLRAPLGLILEIPVLCQAAHQDCPNRHNGSRCIA